MIERKKNSSTLRATLSIDVKAFLGLSHVVTDLYSLWAVKTKGPGICIVPLFLLLTGYLQDKIFLSSEVLLEEQLVLIEEQSFFLPGANRALSYHQWPTPSMFSRRAPSSELTGLEGK